MTEPSGGDNIEPALLARYFSGEASATDMAAIDAWVAADPLRAREIESVRLAWESAAAVPLPDALETSLARVLIRTGQAPSSAPHLVSGAALPGGTGARITRPWIPPAGRRRAHPVWIGVAAAAIVTIGVMLGRGGVLRDDGAAMREYVTARGQRLSVTLVDGTQFMLAPASRLHVPVSFGHDGRSVSLDGEAYFTVVHDATRPFVVHARGSITRDVGTAFDIRAYADDAAPRIAVTEGVVRAGVNHCSPGAACDAELHANDLAVIRASGIAVAHGADVRQVAGWTHGELTLRDVPLREALADVSRWYGVDVDLADPSIGGRPIRATFTTEPLAVVLAVVTHAVGAQFVQHGNRVTVQRDGGAQ